MFRALVDTRIRVDLFQDIVDVNGKCHRIHLMLLHKTEGHMWQVRSYEQFGVLLKEKIGNHRYKECMNWI